MHDTTRISDLSTLATTLSQRYKKAPDRLPRDFIIRRADGSNGLADPVTRSRYPYKRIDDDAYYICAAFEEGTEPVIQGESWARFGSTAKARRVIDSTPGKP